MSREFKIEVREEVSGWRSVWYTVEAGSFEEAREKYENGQADWYDSDSPEDWDETGYNDVQEVLCCECDADSEAYCECERSEDNPDYGYAEGAKQAHELEVGEFIQYADSYTSNQFPTSGWCEVLRISSDQYDEDDQIMITFANDRTDSDWWYVNSQCQFLVLDAEEAEAEKAEAEAKRDQAARERATNAALGDLLRL